MQRAPRGFGHVETWVFDLDNTLYPHHLNLWQQVDERIRSYVAEFLKVSKDEAFRVQKDYYKRYGTTMRGLMTEHGLKPDDYLEYVHQIDHSPLTPNPALGDALEQLPGRKLILTNGTRKHAEAVMARLEIDRHFEDVFDIAAADLDPKPLPQVYERFLALHASRSGKGRDVRGSGAQPGSAARARHDHRAGGAARPARSVPRGLGTGGARRAPCRSRHRRSRRLPARHRQRRRRRNELLHQHRQARCRRCRRRPGAVSRSSLRAMARATVMAASATALWMPARPIR